MTTENGDVQVLNDAFDALGIKAVTEVCEERGPLKRYFVRLEGKTKISTLQNSCGELALRLKCLAPPLVKAEPSSGRVCIEVMHAEHPTVPFASLVEESNFQDPATLNDYTLPLLFGVKNITEPYILDLATMPHLLIGGATGAGKSMLLHSIINSLLIHSETQNIRLALLDPKYVEFTAYRGSKALRYPVYHSISECVQVLEDLIEEMETRLRHFNKKGGYRDIQEYRAAGHKVPYIVLVIDELADLIQQQGRNKPFEKALCRLAQKSRAAGIHIIAATQHPSREVVTGPIKANFPAKVACKVTSQVHSRVILDVNGAERLLGKGDALFKSDGSGLQRFKGAFISTEVTKARVAKNPRKKSKVVEPDKPTSFFGKLFKKR